MIRPRDEGPAVYLCVEPVDGRKQINGLAELVQDHLELNPFLCGESQYVARDGEQSTYALKRGAGPPHNFVLLFPLSVRVGRTHIGGNDNVGIFL